jgi:magnesium-protoporphyrin IX monomethyl ester (oxidative) cyclase
LKLMRKGTSVFQNLQFLKNCLRYKIGPAWNLLIGFPGEPESTFRKYAEDLPLLSHLPPPEGCFTVRFDRYSPYYDQAAEYGLELHPVDYYRLTYPFPDGDLDDLAYYFIDRGSGEYMTAAALWRGKLGELVDAWREKWTEDGSTPQLRLDIDAEGGVVTDSRSGATRTVRLEPGSVALLTHLERPSRLDKLAAELPAVDDLGRSLAQLRDNDLLLVEGERAMSLVMMDTGVDPMPRLRRPTVVGGRRPLTLLVDQPATGGEHAGA